MMISLFSAAESLISSRAVLQLNNSFSIPIGNAPEPIAGSQTFMFMSDSSILLFRIGFNDSASLLYTKSFIESCSPGICVSK